MALLGETVYTDPLLNGTPWTVDGSDVRPVEGDETEGEEEEEEEEDEELDEELDELEEEDDDEDELDELEDDDDEWCGGDVDEEEIVLVAASPLVPLLLLPNNPVTIPHVRNAAIPSMKIIISRMVVLLRRS
jgi:hypothetical protein